MIINTVGMREIRVERGSGEGYVSMSRTIDDPENKLRKSTHVRSNEKGRSMFARG